MCDHRIVFEGKFYRCENERGRHNPRESHRSHVEVGMGREAWIVWFEANQ